MEKAIAINNSRFTKSLLLLGLSLGYFMVLLDTTVVNVALPAIRNDLGGGINGLQWVVNAYTIAFSALLLSMGAIADRLGAKRVYLIGIVIFLAASVASAAAPSLELLIVLRAVLGLGGACLLPASLALLAQVFPTPTERARAMGIWTAVTGVAMAAGPVAGGILVDSYGWRSIFLMQAPVALISLIMVSLLLGGAGARPRQSFDYPGMISAIAAIGLISFVLMEGEAYGWVSPVILATMGLAAASVAWFVRAEAKGENQLLPLRLLRNATISAGMIAGLAINIGLSGILFIVPLYHQQELGMSAHHVGLMLLPLTIPLAFNPIVTGRLVGRMGAKWPMTAGFTLVALGTLLLIRIDHQSSYTITLIGLLLIGFGVSLTIPALMTAVISSAPKELTGSASGALNASRQLGATLGVVLIGSILSSSGTFVTGMHVSFLIAAIILACGGGLSFLFMPTVHKGK